MTRRPEGSRARRGVARDPDAACQLLLGTGMRFPKTPAPLTLLLIVACTGQIGAPPAGPADEAPPPAGATGGPAPTGMGAAPSPGRAAAPPGSGPMPARRLTRPELVATFKALLRLDDAAAPALDLADDVPGLHGYAEASPVSESEAQRLQSAAEDIARAAMARPDRLLPCDPKQAGEDACATRFIETFGRRAWRRPLEASEVAAWKALYAEARGPLGLDFMGAIAHLVRTFVQTPELLYHGELGSAPPEVVGGLARLTPDQVASRISFFLVGAMPDDALFAAADTGRLRGAADVEREARRLLADPRGPRAMTELVRQWLRLWKDAASAPTPGIDAETEAFVANLFAGDGKLGALLTSPVTFANKAVAAVYGLAGAFGDGMQRVALDPAQRFGVLTQLNFLTRQADGAQPHPVRRGAVVYQQLLCGELPPPPDNVPPLPPPRADVSNRERFAAHDEAPCARGCHGLIDPVGLTFEPYDGTGRLRATDAGKPIDPSGHITFPDGSVRQVANARELVQVLAGSDVVARCVGRQWLRYGLGRRETDGDAAAMEEAFAALARSGSDLRQLLVALAHSSSFVMRTVTPAEVM